MVLVPEVIKSPSKPIRDGPGAGGGRHIMTGAPDGRHAWRWAPPASGPASVVAGDGRIRDHRNFPRKR